MSRSATATARFDDWEREVDPIDDPLEQARRNAEDKAELTGDALKFSLIAIALLAFVWPVGIVFVLVCGPRHLRRLYRLVVEPRLRERFLREEIESQVHAHLSEERRQLENAHARSSGSRSSSSSCAQSS